MTITSNTAKRPHRVGTRSTRVKLFAQGREQTLDLRNLSLEGAQLPPAIPVAAGETLHLRLTHPHLETSPQLWAQVRWAAQGGVGVLFQNPPPGTKLLIRRCMLAEFGSAVFSGERLLGYLVPIRPRLWSFYDHRVAKKADLEQADHGLFFKRGGGRERVKTLADAAALAFGGTSSLRIDPTPAGLESAVAADPSEARPALTEGRVLRGSAVYREGLLMGYVAMTKPGSWEFFDAEQLSWGFMTRDGEGPLKLVLFGNNDDGSLDLKSAETYPEAIAAAFGLDHMPQLRSAVIRPAE